VPTRFRYPLAFRSDGCWVPEHPGFLSILFIFPSNGSFPRCGPSLAKFPPLSIGQGSFGLGSPVSGTMTTLRLLIALPVRFLFVFSRCCRFAPLSYRQSLFTPGAGVKPGAFVTRLIRRRPLPPETMSPHTFPYDLLYICPALGPRPR